MKTEGLCNRIGGVLRQGPGVLRAATAFATEARVRMASRATREAPSITSALAVLLSTVVFAIVVMSHLAVVSARFGSAPDGGSSPTVSTDKPDYGPSETVTVSGSGFGAGETLSVLVTAPDGSTLSGDGLGSAGPDSVTADASGAFILSYRLSGSFPGGGTYEGQAGAYRVDVLDSGGTVLASIMFSDGQGYHSCVVTSAGGVKCWGSNTNGQLGTGTFTTSSLPVTVVGLSAVSEVSTGFAHTCALTAVGGLKCWGLNGSGQVGDGTSGNNRTTPVDVSGLTTGVAHVSAGAHHTCAVMTSGGVKCWGLNNFGQVGDGTSANRPTPVDVSGLTSGVARVSAGGLHSCAMMTSGGARCWGYNLYGQVGDGTLNNNRSTPVDVIGVAAPVAQVSAGYYHTCALPSGGGVMCWGYNNRGELGNGGFYPWYATPAYVSGLVGSVDQISLGAEHTCALMAGGGIKCWGQNYYGELGRGTFMTAFPYGSATPGDVVGLTSPITQVSVGYSHSCALTAGSGVKCWGYNGHGEVGNGTVSLGVAGPVDVSGLSSGVARLWDREPANLNQPPAASAGGPYAGAEGTAIPLNGATASDADPGDTLTYAWSVDSAVCGFSNTSALSPILTCSDSGSFTATLTVSDGVNPDVTSEALVTVSNVAPSANIGTNGPVVEGGSVTVSMSGASDPSTTDSAAGFHYAFDCGGGLLSAATYAGSSAVASASCGFPDNGSFTVSARIIDKDDGAALYTTVVNVIDAAPAMGAITVSQPLVAVNTAITASAPFTDLGLLDTHIAAWDWDDGTTSTGSISESPGSGTAGGSHTYSVPGVYRVRVTVTDKDGVPSNQSTYEFVVIYDPTAGFVTGSASFSSPAGAYAANPAATGAAKLGFNAKYKKNGTLESETEFEFGLGAAKFHFHSSAAQWLVLAGAKAQYQGTGTVEGSLHHFGFAVTVKDGQVSGGDGIDTIRLRVWDMDHGDAVVYDSQAGDPVDADATTPVTKGQVKIKK